jgi:hypothetical protein
MPATSSRWRPQGHPHRRHAVRSRSQAGHPREDGIPRAGHRDRDRAEVEGRPGEAGRRAGRSWRPRIRPSASRPTRSRPDHPQGHGRTASRHQGRHPEAHLQGRRQYRRAAGGLSARRSPSGESRLHPQEADRRHGPVRARQDRGRAERAGKGFEFENEIVGGNVPKEYIPGVEKGLKSVLGNGRARRLPGGRRQGHADRRRLPRRRLLGARLRDRGARGVPRSAAEGRLRCCSSRS